ncbi:hypothetical protein [Lysinibacillus fusiformis]|uniref:hypothetical protein n=2 Tax=Lysinibacillus fusiformis TaxID=28031 RepID=UPI0036487615
MKEKVLPVVKKAAQATTKAVKNAVKPKNLLNTLQVGLDLVGLIPGVGEIADGVNGIIYLARGDKVNAALSFGAMIPFVGWAATGGKFVKKGAGVVKSVTEGVQKALKGPVGSVVDQVKKQVVNVKTQIQSKVAEVKQQLRQMVRPPQQQKFALAGGDVSYIEDTGTVGRNTPTPSPKPSNTQPSQNGSNKKPAEAAKGTGNVLDDGTVWGNIKITQPFYDGTKIPKSFELAVDGEKFWVHPNGTKHMVEYITRDATTHGMPVNSQTLLSSFESSVKKAVNEGVKYEEIMNVGNWELIFSKPRGDGLLPVIKHAVYRP